MTKQSCRRSATTPWTLPTRSRPCSPPSRSRSPSRRSMPWHAWRGATRRSSGWSSCTNAIFSSASSPRCVPGVSRSRDDEFDAPADSPIETETLRKFLARAQSFRCRISKNGQASRQRRARRTESGPHVVARDREGQTGRTAGARAEARGAARRRQDVRRQGAADLPVGMRRSPNSDGHAPLRDADVENRHDVALLELTRPAAAHLGHISLAAPTQLESQEPCGARPFPRGTKKVIDFGKAGQDPQCHGATPGTTWHDRGGSSGGACFNENLEFIGVHQGQFDKTRRFVPAELFVDVDARHREQGCRAADPLVARRHSRPDPWSSAATRSSAPSPRPATRRARARCAHQADEPRATSTGLAFSHDILQQLLNRRGPGHRLLRIELDRGVDDVDRRHPRRARLIGLDLPEPLADEAGIAPGQAPPETTIRGRAENLASALEAAAAAVGCDRVAVLRRTFRAAQRGIVPHDRELRRRWHSPSRTCDS